MEKKIMGDANIGKNIKFLRELNRITQAELADFIKVSRVTIAQIETGARSNTLTSRQMEDIAFYFGVDAFDLYESPIIALPITDVSNEDRKTIAQFLKIIKNYFKMKKLESI